MKVRQGWSGEVQPNQWAKFDLELEEEDLRRLLAEHGNPAISAPDAFALLEIEAERLVLVKLMARYGYNAQDGAARLSRLTAERTRLLDRVSTP